MLYLKCPGCRNMLGDKQLTYEKILDEICKDEEMGSLSKKDADELKSGLVNSLIETAKYCCRIRLMKYIRVIDIVK